MTKKRTSQRFTDEFKQEAVRLALESGKSKAVIARELIVRLDSKAGRKAQATTNSQHGKRVVPNRLKQNFDAARDNQKWVMDITALWTRAGWLYLCVFIDCYHRKVIG